MNDNKELNDNLQRLFSTIKDAYGIASMIKDFKEKEVSDKDYEILSYGNKDLNFNLTYPQPINNEIYRVRRASDNQEFKIGGVTDEGIIKSFYEEDGKLWVRFEEKGGVVSLNDIQKVKERTPIFTTEDGQNLYERNDKVFAVKKNDLEILQRDGHTIGAWLTLQNKYKDSPKYYQQVEHEFREKYVLFSTEDKAKEYIYHNKICLSYSDAVHWLASDGSGYGLYKIVKEKIDKQ